MSAALAARTAMRQLAHEAQELVADPRLSNVTKKSKLASIEAQLKGHADAIQLHEATERLYAGSGSSLDDAGAGFGASFATAKTFGLPTLSPTPQQLEALHYAATSKQALRLEVAGRPSQAVTKAASDLGANVPPQLVPGLLAFKREPTRVASLFPTSTMSAPSIEYVRHTGTTGAAGTVAAGGVKPEIVPIVDMIIATARKIAAHVGVVDETLADITSTAAYFSGELLQAIFAVENTQLLSGTGVAPNLQGILGVTGVLTRTQAIAPETPIDTLELSFNDLRIGSSFTQPTGIVMHPSDWAAIRLLKSTQGIYLLGHPAESDGAMLWGVPVVLTTNIPAKTVLVGDFAQGGEVRYRQGVTLETSSSGTDWTSNITRFRAEERLTMCIYRPSCFVKVTLL